MAKTKTVSKAPAAALKYPVKPPAYVKYRWAYYIAAFLIPALLTRSSEFIPSANAPC